MQTVLLASDIHYNVRHFDWLLRVAGDFDAVVLAGDHLDISAIAPLQAQWVVVLEYLRRLAERTTVVACSGNHDLTGRNGHDEKEAAWLAEGREVGAFVDWDTLDRGDVRITVCPWWDGPLTRRDLGVRLAADSTSRPRCWVWVYHPPPSGSAVSRGRHRDFGDEDLRAWIAAYQPEMVLAGHVHESPFVADGSWVDRLGRTWVFNPGRVSAGPIPNHVVLDLGAGTASWYAGGETAEVVLRDGPRPGQPQ